MNAKLIAIAISALVLTQARAGDGHDAGHRWVENHSIDDPANCYSRNGGAINNSPAFTEGCLEYLRDEGITNSADEPRDDSDDEKNDDDNDN